MLFFIIWYIIGYAGVAYWVTNEFDFDLTWAVVALGIAFIGPLTWLIGYLMHGNPPESSREPTVVFKRRNKR